MAEEPNKTPPAAAPAEPSERAKRLEALFVDIWKDSSPAGKALRAKAREKFPDEIFPAESPEDVIEPVAAQVSALTERFDKFLEAQAEAKKAADDESVQSNLETSIANARTKFGLNDEGFEKMVQRMRDTGNYGDPEAAAAWVHTQQPTPKPAGPYLGPANINLFGSSEPDEAFRLLHTDPMGKFLDHEFAEFVKDPDQYVRDAGFAVN